MPDLAPALPSSFVSSTLFVGVPSLARLPCPLYPSSTCSSCRVLPSSVCSTPFPLLPPSCSSFTFTLLRATFTQPCCRCPDVVYVAVLAPAVPRLLPHTCLPCLPYRAVIPVVDGGWWIVKRTTQFPSCRPRACPSMSAHELLPAQPCLPAPRLPCPVTQPALPACPLPRSSSVPQLVVLITG